MELFFTALEREVPALNKNSVRMHFIGDRSRFSEKLQARMSEAENALAQNRGLKLNIAMSYGGKWDIVNAANQALNALPAKTQLSEADLDAHIAMADQEPVDLLIRTGGEIRISNFVLWQAAYAELFFSAVLWPDFKAEQLDEAIASYQSRQRRYGKTGEQIEEESD